MQIQFVDLGPREIEEIVDHAQLVLGAALNVLQVVGQDGRLFGFPGLRRLDGIPGMPEDDVQRRAQFVADIRQQPGFDLVGLLRRQARLLRLLEEQRALQGGGDVAAQGFVYGTVVRADLEDRKSDLGILKDKAVPRRG